VTGAGAPGVAGTVFSLRENPDRREVVVGGCDTDADAVGRALCDFFFTVPAPEDEAYVSRLLTECGHFGAQVIIPQTTRESAVLAAARREFAQAGVAIAIADATSVDRANDKWIVTEACLSAGLPAPTAEKVSSSQEVVAAAGRLGYPDVPVVVKLTRSNGMRGLRVLKGEAADRHTFVHEKPSGLSVSLESFIELMENGSGEWPELMVSQYLPGAEYTVDAFRGRQGARALARLRRRVRSGITFDAEVIPDSSLADWSTQLAVDLDLTSAFGFQWKEDDEGLPRILECNPRVQGTMVATTIAGMNVIWWAVREAVGDEVSGDEMAAAPVEPIRLIRYWGAVASVADGFVRV
jgi:carbamoyl-phosphate synthase large subunit